jgi:hypothetical protein
VRVKLPHRSSSGRKSLFETNAVAKSLAVLERFASFSHNFHSMTTPTRADFDPLKPTNHDTPRQDRPVSLDPPLTPTSSSHNTPISFKRRTPSKSTGTSKVGNLISNLVSNNNSERDVVPSTFHQHRPNAPSHVNLNDARFRAVSESNFSQAVDDEEEDEEDEIGSGDERLGGANWKRRTAGGGAQRLSFAQGTAPPRLVPPYTRNMASPTKGSGEGGGDEEGEPLPFVVTPLPKIPMIVL